MNLKLRSLVAATLTGSVLMGAASIAQADAAFDLLNKLVEKGVLTEEEAVVLMKSSEADKKESEKKVAQAITNKIPIKVSHSSKGFRFETADGNFQTNLLWRAQMRFTSPDRSDPRQFGNFNDESQNSFEMRRVRMKIGGHAYQPWLKYYFEVDLQPTRDTGDSGSNASARVIDWRADIAKYDFATLRLGQWKINYNRERVDSSGKQQFVERSIVNRQFTIDRQVGIQLTGRLFKETPVDMNYWAGVYTGEGRGVQNDDNNLMTMARLQWNMFGRELKWEQSDTEFTEKPTGSFSIAAAQNTGNCTRWSSSGCGNLDGFSSPRSLHGNETDRYDIQQWQQGSAFKYKGFSWQQEYHVKDIDDNKTGSSYRLKGGYAQAGYFFHGLIPAIPKELELAARYARVEEPSVVGGAASTTLDNVREEFTIGANWFMAKHNNKVTLDYSHLTFDGYDSSNGVPNQDTDEDRVRIQWDISW